MSRNANEGDRDVQSNYKGHQNMERGKSKQKVLKKNNHWIEKEIVKKHEHGICVTDGLEEQEGEGDNLDYFEE